jgi:hypothetical protein
MNYVPALAILHELHQKEGAKGTRGGRVGIDDRSAEDKEMDIAGIFAFPQSTAPVTTNNIDLRAVDNHNAGRR